MKKKKNKRIMKHIFSNQIQERAPIKIIYYVIILASQTSVYKFKKKERERISKT